MNVSSFSQNLFFFYKNFFSKKKSKFFGSKMEIETKIEEIAVLGPGGGRVSKARETV